MAEPNSLSKEDLYLLMESYRNMIQMHSTLVEQHKQIIDLQGDLLSKCEESFKELDEAYSNLGNNIQRDLASTKEKVVNNQLEFTKLYSKLSNKIYGLYAVLIPVIGSLIYLLIMSIDRFKLLEKIHSMLISIGK